MGRLRDKNTANFHLQPRPGVARGRPRVARSSSPAAEQSPAPSFPPLFPAEKLLHRLQDQPLLLDLALTSVATTSTSAGSTSCTGCESQIVCWSDLLRPLQVVDPPVDLPLAPVVSRTPAANRAVSGGRAASFPTGHDLAGQNILVRGTGIWQCARTWNSA